VITLLASSCALFKPPIQSAEIRQLINHECTVLHQAVETQNDQLKALSLQLTDSTELPSPDNCPVVRLSDGKLLLGETEWVWLDIGKRVMEARIDSGAELSSLDARNIQLYERDGKRWVRFNIGRQDQKVSVEAPLERSIRIRQASAKQLERRPVVKLMIKLGGLVQSTEFTLTSRTGLNYPILIGRNLLRDQAIVDVSQRFVQPKPTPATP
jgi:hypothetical protein